MDILTREQPATHQSSDVAVQVQNLEVAYGRVSEVLHGVTLSVPTGATVALLGPNGAGKTTILRAMSGLLDIHDAKIRKGSVSLFGVDITREPAARRVRDGLVQVLEGRRVFPKLSVHDNLMTGAHTCPSREDSERSLRRVHNLFPRLADIGSRTAGYLSGGEQQMLAIGRALMARPKVLLLDEPSLGLAPSIVAEIHDAIRRINQEGCSVLIVEQNALMALSLASHGYVLESGRIAMDMPAERLLRDDDIREFYLGINSSGNRTAYRDVKHYKRRKRWLS
ncbi:MAG: ABC transporter ATP-binding protein [Acidimicrobiia bacterium]